MASFAAWTSRCAMSGMAKQKKKAKQNTEGTPRWVGIVRTQAHKRKMIHVERQHGTIFKTEKNRWHENKDETRTEQKFQLENHPFRHGYDHIRLFADVYYNVG